MHTERQQDATANAQHTGCAPRRTRSAAGGTPAGTPGEDTPGRAAAATPGGCWGVAERPGACGAAACGYPAERGAAASFTNSCNMY